MEENTQTNRKLKRRHLIYYLKVMESNTDKEIGFLINITTSGILIMSEKQIEVDKIFSLKVQLKTDLTTEDYLVFDAKSKWCTKSVNSDFYDTGFEMLNVSIEDFKGIENVIEELGFND